VAGDAVHVHGDLEREARAPRKIEAADPLRPLAPGERLAPEPDVAAARIPLADRRVGGTGRSGVRPPLERDGRARRVPHVAARRPGSAPRSASTKTQRSPSPMRPRKSAVAAIPCSYRGP